MKSTGNYYRTRAKGKQIAKCRVGLVRETGRDERDWRDDVEPDLSTSRISRPPRASRAAVLDRSRDVRLRDRPTLDPVSANIRLRLFHEGDEQIGGDGQVDLWPDFFVVGGNLDVGDLGASRVVGMGVVDHLQVEPFVSNILLRHGKVLHIHYEGNLGAFGR